MHASMEAHTRSEDAVGDTACANPPWHCFQGMHCTEPALAVNVPLGQASHDGAAIAVEKVPGAQSGQASGVLLPMYAPALHSHSVLAPDTMHVAALGQAGSHTATR